MTASVVSAAILEGNLIIGLSDGSVINCGYVQGPQGLKGDPGPMGATGDPGTDGNTIITVAGTPRNDVGKDGDYAIDNVNWRIYGPKAGGVWGKANEMLPSKENLITNGRGFEGGTGGSGDSGDSGGVGGRLQTTATLPLANPSKFKPVERLPDPTGLRTQKDLNEWIYESLLLGNSKVTVAEFPPEDAEIGDLYFCNEESDLTLYIYLSEADGWVPAAPPVSLDGIQSEISELQASVIRVDTALADVQSGLTNTVIQTDEALNEINNNIDNITLEKVVDNGNIARKPIAVETENGVSVLEDQALRITHRENPYIRLTDVVDQDSLEITLDNDHGHINLTDQQDELHFKFGGIEKVVFKGEGDAAFSGKVQAQPGTQANELVTYGQLLTVEEELEQLAPALERGAWTWVASDTPGPGQYSIINQSDSEGLAQCEATYNQCLIDNSGDPVGASQCNRDFDDCKAQYNQGPTNDFSKTYALIFNRLDIKGVDHTFADVQKETLVEIFNDNDDGFLVAQARMESHASEGFVLIFADPVKSKGIASGVARVKVFELNDDPASLTNYVRKTGDTMQGQLKFAGNAKNSPLFLLEPTESGQTSNIFVINDSNGNDIIEIQNNGQVFYDRTPDADAELANKLYVDRQRTNSGPSKYRWTFRKDGSSSVSPTSFQCAFNDPGTGDIIRLSRTAMTSVYEGDQNLGQRGNWTFFDSEQNQPLISIWDKVGSIFRIKWSGTARYIKSTSQADFEVKIGTKFQGSSIDNNTVCWISIAGLL